MEFSPVPPKNLPKNFYPATAVITITTNDETNVPLTRRLSRRLSQGSQGGASDDGGGGGGLKRVLSGGGQRRLSLFGKEGQPGPPETSVASGVDDDYKPGKYFWRVKVGVTDTHLILLPESPNTGLSTKPPPLTTDNHTIITPAGADLTPSAPHEDGFGDKIKHFFRRSSVAPAISTEEAHAAEQAFKAQVAAPSSGRPLGCIVVSLGSIETGKNLQLGTGGKKGEGSWVGINITSHFASFVHPMLESSGAKHSQDWAKSGSIRFEFDKEWIGAKAEAEILHHQITTAIQNRGSVAGGYAAQPSSGSEGFSDPFAKNQTLQLGRQQQQQQQQPMASDVAPESGSDLGKVPGERV